MYHLPNTTDDYILWNLNFHSVNFVLGDGYYYYTSHDGELITYVNQQDMQLFGNILSKSSYSQALLQLFS
jgi:hypothetical protein